jgi:D-glycero-alpha-D-manno-heptose 1-phosphate guanylyltransferase
VEAIVLAGGFGTRLQSVVSEVPKSMAPVNGRPFLEYLLDQLVSGGISKVILAVGYKSEVITSHFGAEYRSVPVEYSVENEPLGTGGAIRLALWKLQGKVALALNGDSILQMDYREMYARHVQKNADITLALRKVKNAGRYGSVTMNRSGRIMGFSEKNDLALPGLINGGVYLINKLFLMEPEYRGKFSIEHDCFGRNYETARFFGYRTDGYFIDIGVPSDYLKASHDFEKFTR